MVLIAALLLQFVSFQSSILVHGSRITTIATGKPFNPNRHIRNHNSTSFGGIATAIDTSTSTATATTTATTTTTATATASTFHRTSPIHSPEYAARAISSIPFLKELVHWKDTCNEEYYTHLYDNNHNHNHKQRLVHHANDNDNDNDNAKQSAHPHPHPHAQHIVEYTGRLWFLRKTPVRFQEIVRLVDVSSSSCGTHSTATVECVTKYKLRARSNKSNWIDCSRVLCTFVSNKGGRNNNRGSGADAFEMNVESELLVGVPLMGIRKKITRQISDTFEDAAKAFLRSNY